MSRKELSASSPSAAPSSSASGLRLNDIVVVSGLVDRVDLNGSTVCVCKSQPRADGRIGVKLPNKQRVWIKRGNLSDPTTGEPVGDTHDSVYAKYNMNVPRVEEAFAGTELSTKICSTYPGATALHLLRSVQGDIDHVTPGVAEDYNVQDVATPHPLSSQAPLPSSSGGGSGGPKDAVEDAGFCGCIDDCCEHDMHCDCDGGNCKTRKASTLFWGFRQNKIGGIWIGSQFRVFEAPSFDEAIDIAGDNGMHWDGVAEDADTTHRSLEELLEHHKENTLSGTVEVLYLDGTVACYRFYRGVMVKQEIVALDPSKPSPSQRQAQTLLIHSPHSSEPGTPASALSPERSSSPPLPPVELSEGEDNDFERWYLANAAPILKEYLPPDLDHGVMGFLSRRVFTSKVCWGIADNKAALFIAKYVRQSGGIALEIGGGLGWLAWLMQHCRGVTWIVTDAKCSHNISDGSRTWTPVVKMLAVPSVTHYVEANCLVIMWPGYTSPYASAAIKQFLARADKNSILIYWGEPRGGCTGDDELFKVLSERFKMVDEMRPQQWWGVHDYIGVYSSSVI